MTKHEQVLNFIKLFKGPSVLELYELENFEDDFAVQLNINEWDSSEKILEEIFTSGCCGRFYLILKQIFPESLPYVVLEEDGEKVCHIITRIEDKFYDIKGEFDVERDIKFKEIDEEELLMNDVIDNYSFNKRGPIV